MSDDEGVRKDLEAFMLVHAEVHRDLDERMRSVEGGLREKIGYKFFYTVLAAVMGIYIGVSMFIYNELKEARKEGQETREAVFNIEGKLEPFDFIIDN